MPESPSQDSARTTYLGLRLAMPILVLLLGIGIAVRFMATGCVQPSISAYYYTPLRSLFVATLCAIGTCLIIYRGRNDRENAFLNVSGVMAFVVAFEPTEIGASPCDLSNTPIDQEVFDATRNNVLALLGAGVVAMIVAGGLAVWSSKSPAGRPRASSKAGGGPIVGALGLAVPIVLIGTLFFTDFDVFVVWAHLAAAVTLFVGVVAVVILSCLDGTAPGWSRTVYIGLAVAMALAAGLLLTNLPSRVFWAESLLILLFALYWVTQTIDLELRQVGPARGRLAEDRVLH